MGGPSSIVVVLESEEELLEHGIQLLRRRVPVAESVEIVSIRIGARSGFTNLGDSSQVDLDHRVQFPERSVLLLVVVSPVGRLTPSLGELDQMGGNQS